MEEIQFHVPFWAYTLLFCTALGLLLSVPKFNGKGWLILFLVIRCVTQISNYLPPLLLRHNICTVDQYRAFFDSWGLVFQLLNAISYALIVAFVLALKSAAGMHSGTGRLLFLFRGRVRRQFFWIVWLTLVAVNSVAWVIATTLTTKNRTVDSLGTGAIVAALCLLLWFLVSFWISLATQVKRWHDLDKSGWWVLIGLIPVIGGIWALVETGFLKGTVDSNQFGPAPAQQPLVSSTEGADTGTG